MTKTFFCKLLNNPFNDPIVTVEFIKQGTSPSSKNRFFLFDLGELSNISSKHLQKISHVFVSHMHIDHFIGFDTLIRAILIREETLYVYGPLGIINAVNGHLSGYTWNLVKNYPLKIEVFEIIESGISCAGFYAQNGFNKIIKDKLPFNEIIYSDPDLSIKAAIFDHLIPVLGYAIIEDIQININKDKLIERSLKSGHWLSELKDKIRTMLFDHQQWEQGINDNIYIDGIEHSVEELKDLIIFTKGQKIVYITDIAPSKENIERAIALAKDADVLFIEAYFLEQDCDHAGRKGHLTARAAGHIAAKAAVKTFEIIHVSKKYLDVYFAILDEVNKEFINEK
ncbi:MAG: hypothetical protein HQK91_07475 [Nitrospirae bacterium]|nr:hypothetical protein [Nitrospirota bacterium]